MDDLALNAEARRLDAALADSELTASLSPVVASSFGVLPLGRRRGGLELACLPQASPQALGLLPRILACEVTTTPFDSVVLHTYIQKTYLKHGGVNYNTFSGPDFLADASNLLALCSEKVDRIGATGSALPAGQVVFASLEFRTRLSNLDHMAQGQCAFESSDPLVPFRLDGPTVRLHHPEPLAPDCPLFLQEAYRHDGYCEHRHGIRGQPVSIFPHIIHPTEVQLTGLSAPGELSFYLYDHVESISPGGTATWNLAYHFLSFGTRFRRDLRLTVREVRVVDRRQVHHAPESDGPWKPEDLACWLGLEESARDEAPNRPRGV